MHANAPPPRKKEWHERFARSGYFLGALLFHLILFLMVATIVIWKAPPPPPTDVFHAVPVKVPPPPVQPPSSGAAANNPQFEPQPVVVPVVTPPSVIVTHNSSAISINASKLMDQALSHVSTQIAQGSGLGSSGGGTGTGTGSAFGSFTATSPLLSGYFYDLKQTAARKPSEMSTLTESNYAPYLALLARYIAEGWNDSLFSPYYRSKQPLYTDRFAISTRLSEAAPAAFGLEKEVKPGMWIVHYHAKVQAPEAGNYRLVGFADNIMVVKMRGRTVLDAGWDPLSPKANLHADLPFSLPFYLHSATIAKKFDPHVHIGPSFFVDVADPIDMDVLIGDCGGVCSFYLLIEKEGNTYDKLPDGTPILPFFQLSNKPAPTFLPTEEHPPFSTTTEPWQAASN